MYTVWTKPSTAKKISGMMITPGEAAMAGITPRIVGSVVDAAPGMPLAGTLRTAVSAASVMYVLKKITAGMKSRDKRATATRKFNGQTYYLHAEHGSKRATDDQVKGLRRARYSVRVSKS